MKVRVFQLHPQFKPRGTAQRILQFPLTRSVVAALFVAAAVLAHNVFTINVLERISQPAFSYLLDLETIAVFVLLLLAYRMYTRLIERREAHEISLRGSLHETFAGFAIGGGIVVIMVLLMTVLTYYTVDSTDSLELLLHAFFMFGIGALLQEMVFRGILFRNIEELLGSWAALVVVAVVFGLVHLGNTNATIWTSLAIMGGDLALTGAYMLTRRIWLVWGIHFGWNFFQDGVFGMPNSGVTNLKSWIKPAIDGPEWITGGSFGIEASYIAILMSIIVGVILIRRAVRDNQSITPIWSRRHLIIDESAEGNR